MTTTPGREGLDELHGPWPSPADELTGLYGQEWNIYRERTFGSHGGWVAERRVPLPLHTEVRRAGLVNRLREPTSEALHKALAFQHVAHRTVSVTPPPPVKGRRA